MPTDVDQSIYDMVDKSLVLTFLNREGFRATLTLPPVRDDITESEISSVMDLVIGRNIFFSSGGEFIAKHSAQATERNVTELEVREQKCFAL